MTEFVISGLEEAVGVLKTLAVKHGVRDLWWRGQDVYNWELSPGIFRDYGHRSESNFNLRFRAKAKARYASCPPNDAHIDWLLLAQHYGLPTRLLDWSESMSVGLYFAVQDDGYLGEDGALYYLLPSLLNKNEVARHSIFMSEEAEITKITRDAFRYERIDSEKILAFFPDQFDIRHIAQNTMMTIHGRPQPLDEWGHAEECVVKIRVKREGKELMRELLTFVGTSRANLFPDLENLATEVKQLTFRERVDRKT